MNSSTLVKVYPHQNWRGVFELGTKSDGTLLSYTSGSPQIAWPGAKSTVDGAIGNPGDGPVWFGNLIPGKTDGSGQQYMRNRYYDPQTGRFTQEDPIGLAGGMNLYGYANGDPINLSDPFGLSACCSSILSHGIAAAIVAEASEPEVVQLGVPDWIGGPGGGRAALKAGETAYTQAGRLAHKLWDAGEGFVKEVRTLSGRADAVNFAQRTVKELKPDNPRAIQRGKAQLERYMKDLAEEYGGAWKGILETYKRQQ
jgi:RHS repeat-associated protein